MTELDRSKFIGGSDAAAALGYSKYSTPLQLWMEKTGRHVRERSDFLIEAGYWGTRLEPEVMRAFAMRASLFVICRDVDGTAIGFLPDGEKICSPHIYTGKSFESDTIPSLGRLVHPDFDFLTGEIDGFAYSLGVDGEPDKLVAYIDAKTTSPYRTDWGDGPEDIPSEYYVQVQQYLGILNDSGMPDVPMKMPVLVGGQKSRDFTIERNPGFWAIAKQRLVRFWTMIQDDIEPPPTSDDDDFLSEIYPREEIEEFLEADAELHDLAVRFSDARARAKEKDADVARYRAQIKALTRRYAGATGDGWKLTHRQSKPTTKVDYQAAFEDVRLYISLVCGTPGTETALDAHDMLRRMIAAELNATGTKPGARPFRLTMN